MKFNKNNTSSILAAISVFFAASFFVIHRAWAVSLEPPIADIDLVKLLTRLIKIVFSFTGVLALIQFVYGGIMWMTSGGNAEKVKKGKDALIWAIFGIAIVFLSYALVSFVITNVRGV